MLRRLGRFCPVLYLLSIFYILRIVSHLILNESRLLLGNSQVKLIAKIENQTGMDNFEPILKMADAIVIDRGYLGAEVDVEVVAIAQKKMISLVRPYYFFAPKPRVFPPSFP